MTDVVVEYNNNVQLVRFNRPKKKNAINIETYECIIEALATGEKRDDVRVTVFTGTGDYFSSGNDFNYGDSDGSGGNLHVLVRRKLNIVKQFIHSLIEYPKILVAVVNGPAIGIAVTMLAHFDLIFASKTATFQTPFTSLGLCAEGASTYTFPQVLGKSMAAKMLFFNHILTATEALTTGFVAELYDPSQIQNIHNQIKEMACLPFKSLTITKNMIRKHHIPQLHYANTIEMENLVERFFSEDFANAFMKMMTKKSKL